MGAAPVYSARVLKLASETDASWAARVTQDFDEVLLDHAHCEKKAAGVALRLIFQYPEHGFLMEPLSALAREELAHFEEVLGWLSKRGLSFGRQRPSGYAGHLRKVVRAREPERLLDTLLCSALIEARSCERLGLLAAALDQPALGHFYAGLQRAEARHHGVYVELACRLAGRDAVAARLPAMAEHEAQVLAAAPVEARLHGG